MNGALIYRPSNRKLTWIAFVCAIKVHLGAIAIAANKTKPVSVTWEGGFDAPPVIGTIDPPSQPPEGEIILPSEQPFNAPQEIVDASVTRALAHQQSRMMVA